MGTLGGGRHGASPAAALAVPRPVGEPARPPVVAWAPSARATTRPVGSARDGSGIVVHARGAVQESAPSRSPRPPTAAVPRVRSDADSGPARPARPARTGPVAQGSRFAVPAVAGRRAPGVPPILADDATGTPAVMTVVGASRVRRPPLAPAGPPVPAPGTGGRGGWYGALSGVASLHATAPNQAPRMPPPEDLVRRRPIAPEARARDDGRAGNGASAGERPPVAGVAGAAGAAPGSRARGRLVAPDGSVVGSAGAVAPGAVERADRRDPVLVPSLWPEPPQPQRSGVRAGVAGDRRARARRRHRRRAWQVELGAHAWQRAMAGSALVAVSGTLGLAAVRHPVDLPAWGGEPGITVPKDQRRAPAFAQLAVTADQADRVVPLDTALSAVASGAVAGRGKAIPGDGNGDTPSTGKHALTPQVAAAKEYARSQLASYGWTDPKEMASLDRLWTRESGWRADATNPSSGAYGIPQALPASKLAAAGADWRTNARTQIDWGLAYIRERYGSPSKAWAHSEATGWY